MTMEHGSIEQTHAAWMTQRFLRARDEIQENSAGWDEEEIDYVLRQLEGDMEDLWERGDAGEFDLPVFTDFEVGYAGDFIEQALIASVERVRDASFTGISNFTAQQSKASAKLDAIPPIPPEERFLDDFYAYDLKGGHCD